MTYPEEFVEQVKAAFPDWAEMHRLLDIGNEDVGRLLNQKRGNVDPRRIIMLLEEGQPDQVQREVRPFADIEHLYARWEALSMEQGVSPEWR